MLNREPCGERMRSRIGKQREFGMTGLSARFAVPSPVRACRPAQKEIRRTFFEHEGNIQARSRKDSSRALVRAVHTNRK